MTTYSVIIPALNEADKIDHCIQQVRILQPQAEIIVADGGSSDLTVKLSQQMGADVVHAGRGRGTQCNAGTRKAHGKILLFLHADTVLPPDAFQVLDRFFTRDDVKIGTFRLIFDDPHPLLKLYAKFSRIDSILTRFGDQGITVRRAFLEHLGGFPDWPLFEDVRLLQNARQQTRIYSFPTAVTTSARRYMQNGVVRQQLLNLWVMIQYLRGIPPERLARYYERNKLTTS
jgi:rSAM/selenodomain-associated transferase 2